MNPSTMKKHLLMLHRLYFKTLSIYGERVTSKEAEKVKELQGILQYVQTKCSPLFTIVKTISSKNIPSKKKSSTVSLAEEASLGKRSPVPSLMLENDHILGDDAFAGIPRVPEPAQKRFSTFDTFEETLTSSELVPHHYMTGSRLRTDSGQGRDLIGIMSDLPTEDTNLANYFGQRNPQEPLQHLLPAADYTQASTHCDSRLPEFSLQEDSSSNQVHSVEKPPVAGADLQFPVGFDTKMMVGVFIQGKFVAAAMGEVSTLQQMLAPMLTLKEVGSNCHLEKTFLMYEIVPKKAGDTSAEKPGRLIYSAQVPVQAAEETAKESSPQQEQICQPDQDASYLLDIHGEPPRRQPDITDELIHIDGWEDSQATDTFPVWEPDIKMEYFSQVSSHASDNGAESSDSVAGSRPHAPVRESRTAPRHRYHMISFAEKLEILEYAQRHGVEATSQIYGIDRSRIRRYLTNGVLPRMNAGRKTADPQMEVDLVQWIQSYFAANSVYPSKAEIKLRAIEFATNPNFRGSKGWCEKFLKRNGLQMFGGRQSQKIFK